MGLRAAVTRAHHVTRRRNQPLSTYCPASEIAAVQQWVIQDMYRAPPVECRRLTVRSPGERKSGALPVHLDNPPSGDSSRVEATLADPVERCTGISAAYADFT